MTKDQLELEFHLGLKYLNISKGELLKQNFKHKDFIKRTDPDWPKIMRVFAIAGMDTLLFNKCKMTKNDVELMTYSLHQNPYGESRVRVLHLG